MHKIVEFIHQIKDWTLAWATTPFAVWALFINAFAESSFFPIPPDLLLIAMSVANPKLALLYALICTIGSTLGGMFGYFIGLKGGKPILSKFVKQEKIDMVHNYFAKYDVWAIGIAGFTPLPYKIFTIAGGVFYINFPKFILVSFLSRGARFFFVATMIMIFGEQINAFLTKYFDIFSLVLLLMVVGGFYATKFIKIPKKSTNESQG